MNMLKEKFNAAFPPGGAAGPFFLSVAIWGVAFGCFQAVVNNYLTDIHNFTELERGWLEFFREMPGLLLVFMLALLHKAGNWKVMKLGALIACLGVAALMIPADKVWVILLIMVWSAGEHLMMPVRQALTIELAAPGKGGVALGLVSGAVNVGTVAGSLIVAFIFFAAVNLLGVADKLYVYNAVWLVIALLAGGSLYAMLIPKNADSPARRPRLYFNIKYKIFYALELFYGARKQIFLTFAPFVLIKVYDFDTALMAVLFAVAAGINIIAAPLVGKLTDRIGYRNVMIYDTVILFFVCLLYGYAGDLFPRSIAVWVVGANFLLDSIISTTSLATNLYVRDISNDRDELTSTLSTGISINHLVSIIAAPVGGWIWLKFGVGALFAVAAVMAVFNTLCALFVPKPSKA
jgi:MFS family permease